jgi:hypothetical protein
VRGRRGRICKQIPDDLKEKRGYFKLKQEVGLCGEIALEEAMDLFLRQPAKLINGDAN